MLDTLLLVPEITKGMKSLGSKALLTIKNSTVVLDYQIQQLKKIEANCNIFIGAGFECDKIKKTITKYSRVQIIENNDYMNTNQAKLIKIFVDNHSSSNDLLIVSNGVLFKNSSIKYSSKSKIFLIDKPKANFNIGCNESDNVNYLFYDLPTAWSECVLLDNSAVENMKDICSSQNIDQLFLFELINILIEKYNIVFDKNFISKKDIMKINTAKDISKAKLFI
jgi:choline kinase